jgi:hypothetical protein
MKTGLALMVAAAFLGVPDAPTAKTRSLARPHVRKPDFGPPPAVRAPDPVPEPPGMASARNLIPMILAMCLLILVAITILPAGPAQGNGPAKRKVEARDALFF